MKILNLLAAGQTGGIEVLCQNIILKSKEDNRICCIFEEGEIYDALKEKGVKIFSTKRLNKNLLKIVKTIEDYCNSEKIDIIITHHGGMFCNIIYLMLMKRLKNVKFVRYLHGCFDNYSFGNNGNAIKRFFVKKIMKKALEQSDLIIYISNAVKKSFEDRLKLKNSNNVVIYNGIPNSFFEIPLKKPLNKITQIAYVGRLAKLKGINFLIDAFNNVYKKNKNIKLNIIGDGEEEKSLKMQVNRLGINSCVQFWGREKDVIPILDNMDIFVYPSICEEGFGISVIEAMSRGCIPITFKKGGLPEIIENNKNGILVNAIIIDNLSQAIEKIINLNELEKNFIKENAIKRAKDFKIEYTINELENALKNLL